MASRPFILTLAPLLAALLIGCGAERVETSDEPAAQAVRIDGRPFELELAVTPQARYEGLSGREQIDSDGGMLFVFPDAAKRHFVMRDCLVPIDLIFLDANARVVQMHQMTVEPPEFPRSQLTRYPSVWPAQFAIELKGGLLDELDIANGDQVNLPLDELKARAR